MKQQITLEQWNSLTSEYQTELRKWALTRNPQILFEGNWVELTIGQLIEYLGDDLIMIDKRSKDYEVSTCPKGENHEYHSRNFINEELIHALWEATKYKLRDNDLTVVECINLPKSKKYAIIEEQ